MNDRKARRQALSEWLLEFSVLWAVFPMLDQLIESGSIHSGRTILSFAISSAALAGGILLRKGESQ